MLTRGIPVLSCTDPRNKFHFYKREVRESSWIVDCTFGRVGVICALVFYRPIKEDEPSRQRFVRLLIERRRLCRTPCGKAAPFRRSLTNNFCGYAA